MSAISRDEWLVADEAQLRSLVSQLHQPEVLKPLYAVEELAACSPQLAALYEADLGLLRPCRGGDHADAVLDGFEQDYRQLFTDGPEALAILRLTALLQDAEWPAAECDRAGRQSQSDIL